MLGRHYGIISGIVESVHLTMDSIPLALPMGTRVEKNYSCITQLIKITGIVGVFRVSFEESFDIYNDSKKLGSFWYSWSLPNDSLRYANVFISLFIWQPKVFATHIVLLYWCNFCQRFLLLRGESHPIIACVKLETQNPFIRKRVKILNCSLLDSFYKCQY